MKKRCFSTTLIAIFVASTCAAQETDMPPEDPAHDEIRSLRDGILEAFEKKDIDKMLSYMTDQVVITVQNAELLRGHEQVREFHERMSEGDKRLVKSLKTDFEVDDLSILYNGDTAIAFGSTRDQFQLSSGMDFTLHSRWTATLVKQDDGWKVAALHISTNMFDNGVSNLMIKWAGLKAGGIALALGLVLGAVVTSFWKRRKRNSSEG